MFTPAGRPNEVVALRPLAVAVLPATAMPPASETLSGGTWWLIWTALAIAVIAGLLALPRRFSAARRQPEAVPDGARYRTGDRPGPGRYRCGLCGWVVQLADDPADVSTGPEVATLEPEVRPADAALPVCLGCSGMEAPIYERIADEVPERTRRSV